MPKGGRRVGAGHPRLPRELKVLRGTFREDRHGTEPEVANEFPEPIAPLLPREAEVWQQLRQRCGGWTAKSDVLAIHGVVSLVDRLRRCQDAQQASAEAGHPLAFSYRIVEDGEGDEKKHVEVEAKSNPLIDQELKILRELRSYMAICGLSPRDRAQMQIGGSGSEKPTGLAGMLANARRR